MNASHLVRGLSLLAATVVSAAAALQSVQPLPGNRPPRYPGGLTMEGITQGYAVIAVSIDETGRVKDMLPIAYTHPLFVRASQEVLPEWLFAPAQYDGHPVPVQTELRFDYTVEGAVITSNVLNGYFLDRFDNAGDKALVYQPSAVSQLDHAPVRVSGELPKYADGAARDGAQGRIRVRFYIDEKGDVRQPAVTAGGNSYLAEQAVAAVRNWKFEPVTSRGRPVLVVAEQEFNFVGAP